MFRKQSGSAQCGTDESRLRACDNTTRVLPMVPDIVRAFREAPQYDSLCGGNHQVMNVDHDTKQLIYSKVREVRKTTSGGYWGGAEKIVAELLSKIAKDDEDGHANALERVLKHCLLRELVQFVRTKLEFTVLTGLPTGEAEPLRRYLHDERPCTVKNVARLYSECHSKGTREVVIKSIIKLQEYELDASTSQGL